MPAMTLGANLKALRERQHLTLRQLSERSGVEVGTISALEVRRSTRSEHAAALAKALDVPLELLVGNTLPDAREEPPPQYGVAQNLSLPQLRVAPLLSWETLMLHPLPPRFDLPAPDDSMAPRIAAGDVVSFSTDLQARPGDGVLTADRHGHLYIRLYRQRMPVAWEAHALNDAYQPLQSERDGLRVLAVLVGVQARWG